MINSLDRIKEKLHIEQRITPRKIFSTLGPGLITGAADDDPSGIATYSQTGAQYGLGLLWTALFMLPMMYVVQEMAARIGIVTGKGLTKTIRLHYSKAFLYPLVLLLLIANIINLGTDLGAMGAAVQLFVPIKLPILTIVFTIIVLLLEIFIPYKTYSKVLKWLSISLFAYIITGLFVHQDWAKVFLASITPSFSFNFTYLFIIVGVLGTTISPYMIFWQGSEEVEEEIEHRMIPKRGGIPKVNFKHIGKMKLDTFIGMLFSEVTTWFILVTTATTLHVHGITNITSASEAAQALAPLVSSFPHAGDLAKALFALGIIGTGLLAIPIFASSASYAVCEIFDLKEGLYRKFSYARYFYLIIVFATLIGLLINFIGINPIQALIYTAVINGIISVPLIGMIILITNNGKIMGKFTNSLTTNIIGTITFIIMGVAAIGTLIGLIHT